MGGGGQRFKHILNRHWNAAQRLEFFLVRNQFGRGRQLLMHQQVGDFLELTGVGDVQDVIAAIVQVVAGQADGAKDRKSVV